MADKTPIEWTDASWSPIRARYFEIQNNGSGKERIGWHCEHVTEGCRNCYAERLNIRLGTGRDFKPPELYREEHEGYHNGEVKLFLDEKMLQQPLRWRQPRKIFVCSMTDLFASFVPDEWIDRLFAVMALAPQHTFQVLTKRAQRMRDYFEGAWPRREAIGDLMLQIGGERAGWYAPECDGKRGWVGIALPLANVWLGVSVEDQERAGERIPLLLDTPAATRFISAEPLLGPVDLTRICILPKKPGSQRAGIHVDALRNKHVESGVDRGLGALDWVIVGGESGPAARPMHPRWARDLRDQCQDAGVAFFYKQTGVWRLKPAASGDETWPAQWFRDRPPRADEIARMERVGKAAAGRLLDGREWSEFPDSHSPDASNDGTARAHR